MNSKLFLTIILGILLVSTSSAYFLPTKDYNPETETIKIENAFGLLGQVAEYNLTYNTKQCLINCYAEGTAILHESGQLFSELNFENINGKEVSLENKIYVFLNESYIKEVIDEDTKTQHCETILNGTERCYEYYTYKNETKQREIWKEYNGETLNKGTYKWRIEGKKRTGESIDWIASAFGTDLKEWAWWNLSWNYKIPVNVTETSGSTLSNYSTLIYVNYTKDTSSHANSDFSDIRFTDSSDTTELGYYIWNKSDSNYAYIYVKVPTLTASSITTIHMYYGNSEASSNSNGRNTFLLWDDCTEDGSTFNTTLWSNTEGSPASSVSGGVCIINPSGQSGNYKSNINFGFSTSVFAYANYSSSGTGSGGLFGFGGYVEPTGFNLTGIVSNNFGITHGLVNRVSASQTAVNFPDTTRNIYLLYNVNRINSSFGNFNNNQSSSNNLNSSGNLPTGNIPIIIGSEGYIFSYKRIYVKTFSYSEPTYLFGVEEEIAGSITIDYVTPPTPNNNSNLSVPYFPVEVDVNYINATLYNITYNLLKYNGTGFDLYQSKEFTNETYSVNFTGLEDGLYEYFVIEYYNESIQNTSSSASTDLRFLIIDSTSPEIVLNVGNGTFDFGILTTNHTITYNITDTHLSSCWLNYNLTNISIPCTSGMLNTTNFTLQYNVYNATLLANDSFGNEESLFFSWGYLLLDLNDYTYTSPMSESSASTFIGLFQTKNSLSSAYLQYNNTNYSTSIISLGSNTYNISSTITTPPIDIDTNITWFFWINNLNATSFNQTVLSVNLDNCDSFTYPILLYYLRDENTQDLINNSNSTIETTIMLKTIEGKTVAEVSEVFAGNSTPVICSEINLSSSGLKLWEQSRYGLTDYAYEQHNIQNSSLNGNPENITLYDLNSSIATRFEITYKGNDFIIKEGFLLQLFKQYLGEGEFYLVEAPITSSLGQALISADLNNNKYSIIATKNGIIYDTYENVVFSCDNALVSLCKLNLDGLVSTYNDLSIEQLTDFNSVISINDDENLSEITYSVPSGTASNITLIVSKTSSIETEIIYNETLLSTMGVFEVELNSSGINFDETNYYFSLYKDNELQNTIQIVKLNEKPEFNRNNYFIFIIILATIIGMAISSSPEIVVLSGAVGFIISGMLWLITGMNVVVGLSGIIGIIFGVGILLYKLAHQENR